VRVSHLRVDQAHGDAYTVWQALGSPQSPSDEQRRSLEAAMDPVRLVPDEERRLSADQHLDLDFELPTFGISLHTVGPVN
jgi:xylan 1,4-beta-xylosidase